MKRLLKAGSLIGLGLTIVPAFLVFFGSLTWRMHAVLMAVGALLWFVTAPLWMTGSEAPRGSEQ